MYAYHILPNHFQGNSILPVNMLAQFFPHIAQQALSKYDGREHLKERIVYDPATFVYIDMGPDVLKWGDVSFFTLHHPRLAFEQLDMLGIPRKQSPKVFQIPLDRFSARTMVWLYENPAEGDLTQNDCVTVEQAISRVNTDIFPQKTVDYYKECSKEGRSPLLYPYVPHLLTADAVSVEGCTIIDVD